MRFTDKTVQQAAILWVVRTACVVLVLGVVGMFALTWTGKAIPDQLDRLVNLAGVGALALLGRVSDTKSEAKEAATAAAEKVTDDLSKLAALPPAPPAGGEAMPVTIVDQEKVVEVAETPADPPPPEPAPFRRR